MNIAKFILSTAKRMPESPALTDRDRTISYAEFAVRGRSVAGALRTANIEAGERVVLYMQNSAAYFECLLGCWIAGVCAVPVNAKLHVRELAFIVSDSAAKIVFTDQFLLDEVTREFVQRDHPPHIVSVDGSDYRRMATGSMADCWEASASSHAWQFYTSGTTGTPKGAILTHGNLLAMSLAYYADIDLIDERDHHLHFAPVSHASGLYGLPHLLKGSHQVFFQKFDTQDVLEAITRYPNSALFMAPTMLNRLAQDSETAKTDLSNLKTIYYGGAPMYVSDLQHALGVLGPKLCQIYGQGESPNTITSLSKRAHMPNGRPASPEILASCGVARLGQEVRIVDANGRALPDGECGEIVTRSACVMAGYWNNPDATEKSLRDGWLFTGDIGRFDDRGNLSLIDRSKDVIISGGSNIYPREVEEVLLLNAAIREVSVTGQPSKEWGEEVVAFVSLQPGQRVQDEDLDALCLDNLARFKRPKRYVFLEDLPKSATGKILKSELRKRLETSLPSQGQPK